MWRGVPFSPGRCHWAELSCPFQGDPFPTLSSQLPGPVHRLPFTVHRSLFTVRCSPFTVYCSPFAVHRSLFTVHCSMFTVYRFWHAAQVLRLPLLLLVNGRPAKSGLYFSLHPSSFTPETSHLTSNLHPTSNLFSASRFELPASI